LFWSLVFWVYFLSFILRTIQGFCMAGNIWILFILRNFFIYKKMDDKMNVLVSFSVDSRVEALCTWCPHNSGWHKAWYVCLFIIWYWCCHSLDAPIWPVYWFHLLWFVLPSMKNGYWHIQHRHGYVTRDTCRVM